MHIGLLFHAVDKDASRQQLNDHKGITEAIRIQGHHISGMQHLNTKRIPQTYTYICI